METLGNLSPELFFIILFALAIWDLIWKAFGLWKAARNGQIKWFVAILIINSIGILPIIYLQFFQKQKPPKSKSLAMNTEMQDTEKGSVPANNLQPPTT